MEKIERHWLKTSKGVEMLLNHHLQTLPDRMNANRRGPQLLGTYAHEAGRYAGCAMYLQRPKSEVLSLLRAALDHGRANFEATLAQGQPITVTILGEEIQYGHEGKPAYVDETTWTMVWYLALILRDAAALTSLKAVGRTTWETGDLKSMLDGTMEVAEFLKSLASSIDQAALASRARTLQEQYPLDPKDHFGRHQDHTVLSLIQLAIAGDAAQFNATLHSFLLRFKKYWSSKSNASDAVGFFSKSMTGICAWARDHCDIVTEVQSDYLPLWLVNHDFD